MLMSYLVDERHIAYRCSTSITCHVIYSMNIECYTILLDEALAMDTLLYSMFRVIHVVSCRIFYEHRMLEHRVTIYSYRSNTSRDWIYASFRVESFWNIAWLDIRIVPCRILLEHRVTGYTHRSVSNPSGTSRDWIFTSFASFTFWKIEFDE
jgi:hypothetical protein